MVEIWIRYRTDGIYFCCGGRERKITGDQATRIMSLMWGGGWQTEAIHIMRRDMGERVSTIRPNL